MFQRKKSMFKNWHCYVLLNVIGYANWLRTDFAMLNHINSNVADYIL